MKALQLSSIALSLLLVTACGGRSLTGVPSQNFARPVGQKVNAKWVTKNKGAFVPNEIVIGQRAKSAGMSIQALNTTVQAFGNQTVKVKQQLNIQDQAFQLLEVAPNTDVQALLTKLRANPALSTVELNPRYHALNQLVRQNTSYSTAPETSLPPAGDPALTPAPLNDLLYRMQWSLPKIGVPEVWNLSSQGNKAIKIAIVDSGVDYQHPDLKGQIINGKDFMSENITGPNGEGSPDVVDDDPLDQMGHGTHVAGIIAALPNNETGVAGIAPGVSLLNVKALNADGWGSAFAIAQGITYAVDQGARVINLSLGSPQASKPIELAIKYAQSKGVLLVAAAGNDFTHTAFPANYPGVLAVGAVDDKDWLAKFSNHDEKISVVAPGVDIMSTTPTFLTNNMALNGIESYYSAMSGTSMAAPMVTALAGLLLSQKPDLTAPQLMELIQKSAQPVGDSRIFGSGRIQAPAALQMLAASQPPAAAPPTAAPPDALTAQRFRR